MPKAPRIRRSAAPSPVFTPQHRELPRTPKGLPQTDFVHDIPISVAGATFGLPVSRSPPASRHNGRRSSSRSRQGVASSSVAANLSNASVVDHTGGLPEVDAGSAGRLVSQRRALTTTNLDTSPPKGTPPPPPVLQEPRRKYFVYRPKEESVEYNIPPFNVFPAPIEYTYPVEPPLDPESNEYLCQMERQLEFEELHTMRTLEETQQLVATAARENQRAALNLVTEIKRLDRLAADIAEGCHNKKIWKAYYKYETERVHAVLKAGGNPYPGLWREDNINQDDEAAEEVQDLSSLGKRPREEEGEGAVGDERPAKQPRVRDVYSHALAEMRRQVPPLRAQTPVNDTDADPFGNADTDSSDDEDAPEPKLNQISEKAKGKRPARDVTPQPVPVPERPIPRRPILFGPEPQFVYIKPIICGPDDPPETEVTAPGPRDALSDEANWSDQASMGSRASMDDFQESGSADRHTRLGPGEVNAHSDLTTTTSDDAHPGTKAQRRQSEAAAIASAPRRLPVAEDVFGPTSANLAPRRSSFPARLPFSAQRSSARRSSGRPSAFPDEPLDALAGASQSVRGGSSMDAIRGFHDPLPSEGPLAYIEPPQVRSPSALEEHASFGEVLHPNVYAARPWDLQNTDSEDEDEAQVKPSPVRPDTPRPARHPLDVDNREEDAPKTIEEIMSQGPQTEMRELAKKRISRSYEPEMLLMTPP